MGDEVYYRGKKYIVANGVRWGYWRLSGLEKEFCSDGGWVARSECRKVYTVSNMLHSFKYGYWFYMTSWYDIWCRNGIESWMKFLRIW